MTSTRCCSPDVPTWSRSDGRTCMTRTGRCTPPPIRTTPDRAPTGPTSTRLVAGRTDGPRPRLDLIRVGEVGTQHSRWRPQPALTGREAGEPVTSHVSAEGSSLRPVPGQVG